MNKQLDRLKRASPAKRTAVGESVGGRPDTRSRVKPIRLTLDLAPDLHERFDEWCWQHRTTKAEALRALIEEHCQPQ